MPAHSSPLIRLANCGKIMATLHRDILRYFEERMNAHSHVQRPVQITVGTDGEYLCRLRRKFGLSDIVVHLSDAYYYTLMEYYCRPRTIRRGSFILIARPEASFNDAAEQQANCDGIGFGTISTLMGALNRSDVSAYTRPKRRGVN